MVRTTAIYMPVLLMNLQAYLQYVLPGCVPAGVLNACHDVSNTFSTQSGPSTACVLVPAAAASDAPPPIVLY